MGTADVGDAVDVERATACLAWAGVPGASFVGDGAFDRTEARLRARARHVVLLNRAAIERVAEALPVHQTLDAEQVAALIGWRWQSGGKSLFVAIEHERK